MKGLHNKSILLIDDDTSLLRALEKVLSDAGATVTAADRGGDGIEILSKRKKRFDLIITDLQMPLVNGLTVVSAVHELFPTQPVVVLTAFANPEMRTACLQQGAVAFLEKPIGSQELIAALEAALRAGAHEEIAQWARDLWVQSGKPADRDVAIWLEAEQQLLSAMRAPLGKNSGPTSSFGLPPEKSDIKAQPDQN